MKKLSLTLLSFILTFSMFAGGLVTNTNQSATWTRMMVRDASTSIDAVYYNPAGLTKLSDGFHLSISNQTLGQTKNVLNDFARLTNPNPRDFEGTVSAPMFPGLYAAYKTGKFAFSFGFNPVGGGGSADFALGLPSMELGIGNTASAFSAAPAAATLPVVNDYSANMNFSGTSVYFGFQAGVSYEINEMISVYAGARYIMAKNTYKGELKKITFNTSAGDMSAADYMRNIGVPFLQGVATNASNTATGLGIVPNPDVTPISVVPDLNGGLLRLGYTQAEIDEMANVSGAITALNGAATYYNTLAVKTGLGAQLMEDQEADVVQKGSGFTPILGLNLAFMEDKLNIGIKYEFKTSLILTNETPLNKGFKNGINPATGLPTEMFPDGDEINADMPAMLSIGVKYQVTDALNVHAGYHTYFDGQVGWKNVAKIDGNSMEYALGLEYNINERLLVSVGWLGTKSNVKETYHTDLSYSLPTNSFGAGGAFAINDMITIQLGGFMTTYKDLTISNLYPGQTVSGADASTAFNETYKKSALGIGIGLDFTFGGK